MIFLEAREGCDKVNCPCGLQRSLGPAEEGKCETYMDDHRYLILQLCVQTHSQAQVALAERRSICCHTGRPGGELPSAQALGDASNGVGVVVCTAETDDLLDPWPLAYLVEDVGSEGASCAGEDLQMSSESGVRSARNSPRHDR